MELSLAIGFGTYLAVCATIYKVCEKGDDIITDDTKLSIAIWILDLKPAQIVQNWPSAFTSWFDRVFGKKHLAWKCFFRSSIASFLSVILVLLIWAAIRSDELNQVIAGYGDFWNPDDQLGQIRGVGFSGFMIFLLLSVFLLNLLPDYVSLLETRYILGKMSGTGSGTKHLLLLVLDIVLTVIISAAIPVTFFLFTQEKFKLSEYFLEVIPLTGNSALFERTGFPFLSICFYTSFFTSVWLWGYAFSGFLLKLLSLWEFAKEKIKIEEKPLSSIGLVSIFIITIVCSIIWFMSAGSPQFYGTLRSEGQTLSVEEAQQMIKDRGYFDRFWNIRGRGVANDYHVDGPVVYHNATGLYWEKGGSSKYLTYKQAQAYIDSLNQTEFAGHSDWRLPTLEEAMSLMEPTKMNEGLHIYPVFDPRQRWIWTADRASASAAWSVVFSLGLCSDGPVDDSLFVRAVRSRQSSR